MSFMELLLFWLWILIWGVFTGIIVVMYFDLKHTIKEETISWVHENDKLYRVLRKFIEKHHPEIIEQCKESL